MIRFLFFAIAVAKLSRLTYALNFNDFAFVPKATRRDWDGIKSVEDDILQQSSSSPPSTSTSSSPHSSSDADETFNLNLSYPAFHSTLNSYMNEMINLELNKEDYFERKIYPDVLGRFYRNNSIQIHYITKPLFRLLDRNNDNQITYDELHCEYDLPQNESYGYSFKIGNRLLGCASQSLTMKYQMLGFEAAIEDLFKVLNLDIKNNITEADVARTYKGFLNYLIPYGKTAIDFFKDDLAQQFIQSASENLVSLVGGQDFNNTMAIAKTDLASATDVFYDEIQRNLDEMENNIQQKLFLVDIRFQLATALVNSGASKLDISDTYIIIKKIFSNVKPTLKMIENELFDLLDQQSNGVIDPVDIQNWANFLMNSKENTIGNTMTCLLKLAKFQSFISPEVKSEIVSQYNEMKEFFSNFFNAMFSDQGLEKISKDTAQHLLIYKLEFLGGDIRSVSIKDFDEVIAYLARIPQNDFYALTRAIEVHIDKSKYPIPFDLL